MFDIIMNYPESEPTLLDMRVRSPHRSWNLGLAGARWLKKRLCVMTGMQWTDKSFQADSTSSCIECVVRPLSSGRTGEPKS